MFITPSLFYGETCMIMRNAGKLFLGAVLLTSAVNAKPLPSKYGKMQGGHAAPSALQEIKKDAEYVQNNYTQAQYQRIVEDPYNNAKSDEEKVAAIAAREIIFLVDRSGSMGGQDQDPSGKNRQIGRAHV